VLRGGRGPRRPKNLCLDKGYDYKDTEAAIRKRRITPHIRRKKRKGEKALMTGRIRGKARRWVVERTNSWHNQFRGLLVRWDRKGSHYDANCALACALIVYRTLSNVSLRF
jgi:IS5 family transposase